MKVLLLGHRSFAARGLRELLISSGHEVICFSRGEPAQSDGVVTGPVDQLCANRYLDRPFDTVINYILLKDDPVATNIAYVNEVLNFCAQRGVGHLIHISSVSSYQTSVRHIHETAPTEPVPERKGSYGSLKVATDLFLMRQTPPALKLSLVRPGFILGPGVGNPIIGNAARLPWNSVLILGSGATHMPLIRRTDVNQAVARLVASPPAQAQETLLLVAPNSPTKREFLEACCRQMGVGTRPVVLPVPIWYGIAISAEMGLRLLGQGKMKPYSKLASRLICQDFSADQTQQRLGLDFRFDWPPVLRGALEGQEPNYDALPLPTPLPTVAAPAVTFLGFGRIVKQKHLPALAKLGFHGQIRAYDLRAGRDPNGQEIAAIDGTPLEPSGLYIVASPGPAHIRALPALASAVGPVLVEKPVGYSATELDAWLSFAQGRSAPVYVCHNYRFKDNVRRLAAFMHHTNPGQLKHVHVHFQSPAVSNDGAPWLRAERRARTLLMDYALHFMDLACMFGRGPWQINTVRHELDAQGNTGLIEGNIAANYSVSFLLRQGFAARRARLLFTFQNYCISLGFFPDTFAVYMSDDNPWHYKAEKKESMRGTLGKIRDKLTGKDHDLSHAVVLASALGEDPASGRFIELSNLESFYRMLFAVADAVYGAPAASSGVHAVVSNPAPSAVLSS
ncbi:MAG: NAD-dependent epimerase/dehydratase family protein [Phycisphaerae bacterium]